MGLPEMPGTSLATPSGTRAQRRAWIAQRILGDLVGDDAPAGSHVTELALAGKLGVSRSPVRAALQLLAEHGVLVHAPNRGYFLAGDARGYDGIALSEQHTPEDALYLAILGDRLRERISGSVTQVELARRYDAPQRRVAAVLARLREEGLVRRNPGRGWTFEPAIDTPEAFAQSYAFRLALEPAALAQPGLEIDAAALGRARRRHETLLSRAGGKGLVQAQVFEVDAGFHELLVSFSGNPYFLEAIQTQNRLRRMVEFVEYSDRARIALWCREHLAIIDALEGGRADTAATLLTAHLQRASRAVVRR